MSLTQRFLSLRRGAKHILNFKIQVNGSNNGITYVSNKNYTTNYSPSFARLRFINYNNFQSRQKACLYLGPDKVCTIQKRGYAKGRDKGKKMLF